MNEFNLSTPFKLGKSPLTLDGKHLKAHSPLKGSWQNSNASLLKRFNNLEVAFSEAILNSELNGSNKIGEYVQIFRKFKHIIFIGIGGSSLGPISMLSALEHKTDGPQIIYLENPDPHEWKKQIRGCDQKSTGIVWVTKSGTTFETLALGLLALDWLGKDLWSKQVLCITDPKKGDLRNLVNQYSFMSLPIEPGIGGRFSIFSPVGLFPAAIMGLSVQNFLKGAQEVREWVLQTAVDTNPMFYLADALIRFFPERKIHVCMPYSTPLRSIGSWFVQMWGESLGKDGKGFTPVGALGATDQHSLLQLMRDGPDDKVTHFIEVTHVSDPVSLPKQLFREYPAFELLLGSSLHGLLQIESAAIQKVLTNASRPFWKITLEALDERNLGALYAFYSYLTAITGSLWGMDAFDQPGVEEGKIYIREALQLSKHARNS